MPTLQQFVQRLVPMAKDKKKHKHYDHVVGLSRELYRPLMTGADADHLIRRFNLREDEDAYKQRLRLTQLITPAITNTLMAPARKLPKVRPTVNTVSFDANTKTPSGTSADQLEEKLEEALSTFYAGKGVDHYLGSVLLDQGAIDPNAFCMVLFGDFDAKEETPKIYPSIISSADAWNYEYQNGVLQWLLVHRDYEYEQTTQARTVTRGGRIETSQLQEPKKAMGHAWWLYTDNYHIMLLQVDKGRVNSATIGQVMTGEGVPIGDTMPAMGTRNAYWLRTAKDELYEVVFYEHKSGAVQGFRLGFVPDHRTKGETMVNLWHAAMPYLLKGVKAGSELDLSAALHAFLQKLSYENPCPGHWGQNGTHTPCDHGRDPGGHACKACNGSGFSVHRSGQDHITLAMPRDADQAFDLSKLTHYVQLPVEVLEWQDKYVDKLERACYRAVYNSDRFRPADATTTTATGDIIDLQSIYDTLKPAADWYSQSRILIVKLTASAVVGSESLAKLSVHHEFPRNMRFESTSERVKLLADLRNAGASNGALMQVDNAILEDLYIDDPESLKKAQTMAWFDPFVGKKEDTILALISQDLCTREAKVMWTNQSGIYDEAEARMLEKGLSFYDLTRRKQREVLDEIIAELIAKIDGQADEPMPRLRTGTEEEEDDDEGSAAPGEGDEANLPPSPGESATA